MPMFRQPKKEFVPRTLVPVNQTFTDEYKEKCFLAWYEAGCPKGTKFVMAMPKDEEGRVPHLNVLNGWRREEWDARAAELNNEVWMEVKRQTIEAKVEMYAEHAKAARELREQGMSWFENNTIDSAATALRAIVEGVRIERESVGIPSAIKNLAKMSDANLSKVVEQLIGKMDKDDAEKLLENTDIDENTVEGDFEDTDDDLELNE